MNEPMFDVRLLYGSIRIDPMPPIVHDDGSMSFPHRHTEYDRLGNVVSRKVVDSGVRLLMR